MIDSCWISDDFRNVQFLFRLILTDEPIASDIFTICIEKMSSRPNFYQTQLQQSISMISKIIDRVNNEANFPKMMRFLSSIDTSSFGISEEKYIVKILSVLKERELSSNDLKVLERIYMQIVKFKGSFNYLTQPLLETIWNGMMEKICSFNLNINPSEDVLKIIEMVCCRLVAMARFVNFADVLTETQLKGLDEFIKSSWNNPKIINKSKAYICRLKTIYITEGIERMLKSPNDCQINAILEDIKLFIVDLLEIITPDHSNQNEFLCENVFQSLCLIFGLHINQHALLGEIFPESQENILYNLEMFLIKFVFEQKLDTTLTEEQSLIIEGRSDLLKEWINMFKGNSLLPLSLDFNQILKFIVTVSTE